MSEELLLSKREVEVLRLLSLKLSNQEIAAELYVSLDTVKSHLKRIYGKLGVHDRNQAVARAWELDLLSNSPYARTRFSIGQP